MKTGRSVAVNSTLKKRTFGSTAPGTGVKMSRSEVVVHMSYIGHNFHVSVSDQTDRPAVNVSHVVIYMGRV